ncbi:MAG: hypothetical protein AB7T06_11990 [Kofleriaceae bacterium]
MTKHVLALAVLIGASSAAAQPAPAPSPVPPLAEAPRIKVAIIPGIAVNLDSARVDALSQDLADALASELDVDAVGGLEVRRSLPADGIPPDCVATPACFNDVAQRVGANQLLFVVMVDTGTGGAIQIDSTWVEPSTGKSASRPAIDIASLTEAKSRFVSAAPTLLPDAPKRPKPVIGGPDTGPKTQMSDEVPRHFTLPAKITAGVAVAGLGVGVAFGLITRSKFNSCEDSPQTCDTSKRDSIRVTGIVADAGYLVAIGGAVTTVVLFAMSGKESQLIIAPNAEGGGGTVGWSGRF